MPTPHTKHSGRDRVVLRDASVLPVIQLVEQVQHNSLCSFPLGVGHPVDLLDFLAAVTPRIPPKRLQLIGRCRLYASRTKGCWNRMPHVASRAPEAWRASRAWARLLAKVYEIDPLVCPKCGCEDEVQVRSRETAGSSAVPNCNHLPLSRIRSECFRIQPRSRDILAHLVKIGRAPPGFDPESLN